MEAKLKQLQKKGGGKGSKDEKGKNGTNKNKKSFLPPWHKEKPKPDKMKKPREYNNKKWYWCCPETGGKCTGIWRTHKPEECRGTMKQEKGEKRKPTQDIQKGSKTGESAPGHSRWRVVRRGMTRTSSRTKVSNHA